MELGQLKSAVPEVAENILFLDKMAKELQDVFANQEVKLKTEINSPVGGMVIYNYNMNDLKLDHYLSELLDIEPKLMFMTFVKRLASPSTYFIYCDLVDKEQNLLNGNPSTVLARFDVRGEPFEKIHYQTTQHVLRDTSTYDYVNSLTISVRDVNGNLFYFNGLPLEFELEIN